MLFTTLYIKKPADFQKEIILGITDERAHTNQIAQTFD